MSKFNKIYIGVGTNLGDKLKNITKAYSLIQSRIGDIQRKSHIYKTPPWGFESNNEFYNTVVIVNTLLGPKDLLCQLKSIEKSLGRSQLLKIGYSSRLIDLDIICFNRLIIDSKDLTIPHLHLKNRAFVLYPLKDVDSTWVCPRTNISIESLINKVGGKEGISRVII